MNTSARTLSAIGILLIVIIAAGWLFYENGRTPAAEAAVRTAVTDFGGQLQKVSLLAPDASQEIAQTYGPYADASLIASWQNNPSTAPGRTTSSPWPDHIDITSITKGNNDSYTVMGSVVLMTSNEVEHGGNAGTIPVTLSLQNEEGKWRIVQYSAGAPLPGTSASLTVTSTTTSTTTTVVTPPPSGPATTTPSHGLSITSIAPSSGPSGTFVTLRGTGFDSTSQVIIGNGGISNVSVNSTGTLLTFTMPSSLGAYCLPKQACPMYLLLLKPGTYSLNVRNADGSNSNAMSYTLTGTDNTLQ